MPEFSANLGFLWNDRPLPEAIAAAAAAGFAAVECHWPYAFDAVEVRAALKSAGLEMLGLNTVRGDIAAGENGLAALPGREDEARAAVDQALRYAAEIGCGAVHVMGGRTDGNPEAEAVFRKNLGYACERAALQEATILIEPLNHRDAPGYHLRTVEQALATIAAVGAPNLKLMFDCYHVQVSQGDVLRRLQSALPHVGHIQIAGAPDRGEPDAGELDYGWLIEQITTMGWKRPLGAEYRPRNGSVEAGLGWMSRLSSA
ncbi:MAG: hydroxypyruvate isomerase family protein [Rubrimonas sp.]